MQIVYIVTYSMTENLLGTACRIIEIYIESNVILDSRVNSDICITFEIMRTNYLSCVCHAKMTEITAQLMMACMFAGIS